MVKNRIINLFKIRYPIIQGGMVWVSGWRLASAVSQNGGLGLIGAGSMNPETLREHIQKCQAAIKEPFGVNLPLLYNHIEEQIQILIKEKVKIVFTSAGDPTLWTKKLQDNGIKVVHLVSSIKFAIKSQQAGVDAIVAEGFEAGGHNGREETASFCLIPMIRQVTDLPLIAAGGIATGEGILASMILGAEAAQIGSRWVTTDESSAHPNFKSAVIASKEGDTGLTLRGVTPIRVLKNNFYEELQKIYKKGASVKEIKEFLGKDRLRKGIFQGDLENGELEIGQISALINNIQPVEKIFKTLLKEYRKSRRVLFKKKFDF